MKRFLKINAADNVAVALADDLHEGETLDVEGVACAENDYRRGEYIAARPENLHGLDALVEYTGHGIDRRSSVCNYRHC